jgi:hypothetical protein
MSDRKPQAAWQAEFVEAIKNYPDVLKAINLRNKNPDKPAFWWVNSINPASLRITRDAYRILRLLADYKMHRVKLDESVKPKTYLQLEDLFAEPYYIENNKTIHLHGEKDLVMVTLHDNNLQKYLDNASE